jgi:hypothetical protein
MKVKITIGNLTIGLLMLSFSGIAFAGFEERANMERKSHKERIAILEEAEQCVNNAKTRDEYATCERKENQARSELKQRSFEEKKAFMLKKINERRSALGEAESCVKAAIDGKALRSCMKGHRKSGGE